MTVEYRRILLDGYPILTTRDGDRLVTRDGRSIGLDEAVHLPPCNPTKIVCVHLNYHSRVDEFISVEPRSVVSGSPQVLLVEIDCGSHDDPRGTYLVREAS